MSDRLYNSNELAPSELPFKDYFERVFAEFHSKYEIWIRNEDFERSIAVGIVRRDSNNSIAVTIYFKYGNYIISNPLHETILNTVRQHLISGKKDLVINQLTEQR